MPLTRSQTRIAAASVDSNSNQRNHSVQEVSAHTQKKRSAQEAEISHTPTPSIPKTEAETPHTPTLSIPKTEAIDPEASISTHSSENVIFIKTLTGKTITFSHDTNESIGNLKQRIQDREGCPVDMQRLIYNGCQLDDEYSTIGTCLILPNSNIHLVLKLRGD